LLDIGGLAVVGSRHVDEELISYTENVGRLAAEAGRTLISGGAKGIDSAAMNGVLQPGGAEPKQETLPFELRDQPQSHEIKYAGGASTAPQPEPESCETKLTPAQILFASVRKILRHEHVVPETEPEVARLLDVSKSQAKEWLKKLVADGELEKLARPVRYRAAATKEDLVIDYAETAQK